MSTENETRILPQRLARHDSSRVLSQPRRCLLRCYCAPLSLDEHGGFASSRHAIAKLVARCIDSVCAGIPVRIIVLQAKAPLRSIVLIGPELPTNERIEPHQASGSPLPMLEGLAYRETTQSNA